MPDTSRPNPADRLPKRIVRTPGDFGRGHLKVDNMLRDEDRDAYFALLRQPGTTCRKAHEWLLARGYKVSLGAVKHHKRRFNQTLKTIRASAEMSLACAELARQVGAHKMSDAAVLRFEMLLTEALANLSEDKKIDPAEWETMGRALTQAVASRVKLETMTIEIDQAKQRASETAGKGGKPRIDGNALSDKVRRFLNMPLPGEPPPSLPAPALPPPVDPPAPPAPEGRQTLAHDASRGEPPAPEGRRGITYATRLAPPPLRDREP